MEDNFLCFVKYVGQDTDEQYIYELMFTNDAESFWGENFEYEPAGLCNDLIPDKDSISIVEILKTNIKFKLAQESCCFSYQDCIDGIIPCGWEDLSDYDEYPEPFRIILKYGMEINELKKILIKRNLLLKRKEDEN